MFFRICIAALLLLTACRSQKPVTKTCPLTVRYEAYGTNIIVSDGHLSYVHIEYEFPSPQVATPSKILSQTIKDAVPLSSREVKALEELISESGFLDLEKAAYGAPEGVRYYGYSLDVTSGCRQKSVLYRSNPEYDAPMPEAFVRVQDHLKALAGAD